MDEAVVLARVQAVVAGILGAAAPPDQPLMEAGIDSLGAHFLTSHRSKHYVGSLQHAA